MRVRRPAIPMTRAGTAAPEGAPPQPAAHADRPSPAGFQRAAARGPVALGDDRAPGSQPVAAHCPDPITGAAAAEETALSRLDALARKGDFGLEEVAACLGVSDDPTLSSFREQARGLGLGWRPAVVLPGSAPAAPPRTLGPKTAQTDVLRNMLSWGVRQLGLPESAAAVIQANMDAPSPAAAAQVAPEVLVELGKALLSTADQRDLTHAEADQWLGFQSTQGVEAFRPAARELAINCFVQAIGADRAAGQIELGRLMEAITAAGQAR